MEHCLVAILTLRQWQSAWTVHAATARGLQGEVGREVHFGAGCKEERAFGVAEGTPGALVLWPPHHKLCLAKSIFDVHAHVIFAKPQCHVPYAPSPVPYTLFRAVHAFGLRIRRTHACQSWLPFASCVALVSGVGVQGLARVCVSVSLLACIRWIMSQDATHTHTHTCMHAYIHTCMHACMHAHIPPTRVACRELSSL